MTALYDSIGLNYADLRKPDPRIASAIMGALCDCRSVVNVGAGTGSYEPTDRQVVAVEPSIDMIRKRVINAVPAVQASAEKLPFDNNSFDAAMAILTVHHWRDKPSGLRELRRVARGRVVLLTFDPASRPWLTDYLPELAALDEAQMPSLDDYEKYLGPVRTEPLLIPHDCSDGFLYAYWRRPQAYLDPRLRSGSSSFWALPDVSRGIARLSHDLETGEWARRYANLLESDVYDAGYRLVVTVD
ncbi:class I SAM-dependent methyltransferase [Sphingopyxis sp. FD7]|uniref:class I SAM-dependent methyltransferase n=1 Tax=Sphingopyxis sp. FD7 TaxID=1914525 RepID=UPI000DC62285|nr:class I SAM-dependent methyltransferase [Sphingopyxis sp. FD7]BBB13986.1 MerR family transcriptional regulator [Sphingopyxis sp. FD7]